MGPAREGARRAGLATARLPARYPKTPYASVLFGDTPDETLRVRRSCARGISSRRSSAGVRSGGRRTQDADHFAAAREGLGDDGILLVDAGQIFGDDVERAAAPAALSSTRDLARGAVRGERARRLRHAGAAKRDGEARGRRGGAQLPHGEAPDRLRRVGFIQIDCGRIGGIAPAKAVADYATTRASPSSTTRSPRTSRCPRRCSRSRAGGHRSASIRRSRSRSRWRSPTSRAGREGRVPAPDAPGLGIAVSAAGARQYLQDVDIRANGRRLFATAEL